MKHPSFKKNKERYYIIDMNLKKVFDVFDTINLVLKKRRPNDLVAFLYANDVEKFLADIRKGE